MNQFTKKNQKIKFGEKISVERVNATLCISEKYFNALCASTTLSLNRSYSNADITIIHNIAMLSICNQVKLMFDVKNIKKESDRTILCGDNYNVIVGKPYSEFKEEFLYEEKENSKTKTF